MTSRRDTRPHISQVIALCAAAFLTGCAARSAGGYRLIAAAAGNPVLLPPQVAATTSERRSFRADLAASPATCPRAEGPITLRTRRKQVFVTVSESELAAQPPGWLRQWIGTLEASGCIPQGSGPHLADQIVESVAMDPSVAFRLLHDNLADLVAGTGIQVRSPIVREGASPGAPLFLPAETSEASSGLNVALKATRDFLGTETDLYNVRPRPGAPGVVVTAISAEENNRGDVKSIPAPARNYFRFAPEAAFYRLFYKASENGSTALIVAAPTYAELDRKMATLDADGASCEKVGLEWCVAIPKLVAVNIVLPVKVNGSEIAVRYGATVAEAIRGTGERRPEAVLAQLHVWRTYRGQPTEVHFDRTSPTILQVPIFGGESISWK
jgi:hypothetical protein